MDNAARARRDRGVALGVVVKAALQQQANAPSFEAIFAEQIDFVVRSLLRLGVQERDVEDAAQQVFIVVHRRLFEYDATRSMRAWLWGIARRTASDYRELARHRIELDDGKVARTAIADGAEAGLTARQMVHRALEDVEPGRREVLVLYEMEGMTLKEVAEITGAPLNTVASRLRKARSEFAEAVGRLEAEGVR